MARDTRISTVAADAEANATGALLDGGYLRTYASAKPEDADTEEVTPHLTELRFGTPAFRAAIGGAIASYPLTPDLDTPGDADAVWYRTFMADGVTPVFDGTVGVTGCNLNFKVSARVRPHGEMHIASVTYTVNRKPV